MFKTRELENLEVLRAGSPSLSESTMDWMPLNLLLQQVSPTTHEELA